MFAKPSLGEAVANMTVADFFSVLFSVYLTCPIIVVYHLPDIITAAIPLFGATIDCTPFGILTCLLNFVRAHIFPKKVAC